jgi:hypothetical protein
MIAPILVAFAILAAAAFGLWQAWPYIAVLEPGAGAFVGAFGGLNTILAGALFNAWLNRRRDTHLSDRRRDAFKNALRVEISNMQLIAQNARSFFNQNAPTGPNLTKFEANERLLYWLKERMRLPPSTIFEALKAEIALLDEATSRFVVLLYFNVTSLNRMIDTAGAAEFGHGKDGFLGAYAAVIKEANNAIAALDGKPAPHPHDKTSTSSPPAVGSS